MKRLVLFASIAIAAGLTLVNVYTSLVDVPAWSHHVPASIETARKYYSASNPGNFFRIFSPLNQLLGLVCLLLFWKRNRQVRVLLSAAFLLYVIGEGMTFMYFYPRNAILFGTNPVDTQTLQATLKQWSSMNWLRSLIIAIGCVCSGLGLHHSYKAAEYVKKVTASSKAKAVLA